MYQSTLNFYWEEMLMWFLKMTLWLRSWAGQAMPPNAASIDANGRTGEALVLQRKIQSQTQNH